MWHEEMCRKWGRVACICTPGTIQSKISHQFHNLDALVPQNELLVSIRMGFRASLDRRLTRKVAASVMKWNHTEYTDTSYLKKFLIYSEALNINLNGVTKIMPFTIIFKLLWFYLNRIPVPCQQHMHILLLPVRSPLSLPPLGS